MKSSRSNRRKSARRQCKVPHWEKAHLYPKGNELSIDEWRWEFLRRDPDYMEDWLHYRAVPHPFQLSLKGDPESEMYDLPYYPEEVEDRWDDIWRIFRKYGLSRLRDPDVSRPKYLRFHFVPFRPDIRDIPELRDSGIESLPWKLCNPFLAWFELWHPIEPQVTFITELLKREQLLALQALKKMLPAEVHWQNKTLDDWEPLELEPVPRRKTSKQAKTRQGMSSMYPYAIRNRPLDPTGWPTLLRVWDAKNAGCTYEEVGVKILGHRADDYSKAFSNAQASHLAAMDMWRKIRAERIPGPGIGLEELRFNHCHNVVPPYTKDSSRLDDWLNCLHPRLHELLLPVLL